MRLKMPNPDTINSICSTADSVTGSILLNLSDELLKPFIENYKKMKLEYITNCDNLLSLLETEILKKVGDNYFTLRELNYTEINKIEREVKTIVAQMTTNCHKSYLRGIKLLEKYVIQNKNRSFSMNTNDIIINDI